MKEKNLMNKRIYQRRKGLEKMTMNVHQWTMMVSAIETRIVPSASTMPDSQENRFPEQSVHTKSVDSWSKHPEAYEDVFGLNEIFDRLRPINRPIIAAG